MANLQKDTLDHHIENFQYATSLIKIIFILIGGGIFMFSRYAFIFFAAAMLPSIAVIFADRAPHKCASATICTFNLMGVVPYLKVLWLAPSFNSGAKDVIADPIAWIIIYSTAFLGFVIYLTLPAAIARLYVVKANMRIAKLVDHRNQICSEWDIKLDEVRDDNEEIDSL